MKVVLLQDIKGTGAQGDVVNVSDGYARNYLFPRKLAKEASVEALADVAAKNAAKAHHAQLELDAAKEAGKSLDGKSVAISAKCGANGKLFGAITAKEIAAAVLEQLGVEVNKKKIVLAGDIKTIGDYTAQIKLHPLVSAELSVKISE